jgi:hypothetical protein
VHCAKYKAGTPVSQSAEILAEGLKPVFTELLGTTDGQSKCTKAESAGNLTEAMDGPGSTRALAAIPRAGRIGDGGLRRL